MMNIPAPVLKNPCCLRTCDADDMFGSSAMYISWCGIIKKQCNVPLCGLDSYSCSLSVTVISLSLPKQILHPSEEEEEEGGVTNTVSERERNLYHAQ